MNQIRQGDVFLTKAPDGTQPEGKRIKARNGRLILAEGESTGHHHSVASTACNLFGGDKPVLVVREHTTLDHQEHGAIEIDPGTYWVVRQREYTPEAIRNVMD
jgi:hypothetical protein